MPTETAGAQSGVKQDSRCATGIPGLDQILDGGLPHDCAYLIQGEPGAGKTTFALQFLLEGVRRGEKGFYITLSETGDELWKVARSHGWSLDGIALLELSAIEVLLRPERQTTIFHPSEIELNQISQLLLDETRKHQPRRIVFDSLSEFRLMAETPLRYRRQLLNLKQEFARHKSTVLLLDDRMGPLGEGSDTHVLSISHGVIELEQVPPEYGQTRRRLQVLKMRGVKFREGFHDFKITTGGMRVFPRLIASQNHASFAREPVSSGIAELDALLGGGFDRGTTTLIVGQAGTGKSTLTQQLAVQMAQHGEKGLFFVFDEIREIMLQRARLLGLELDRYVERGLVEVQQIDPAEISPGEFSTRIREGVARGCKLVCIDSLSGYMNAMPGERFLTIQLHEVCCYLNQQGVITLIILPAHGLISAAHPALDVSYLADTVMSLQFFEAAGEVRQAISVIKKRTGPHEKTIREFRLESGKGIRIGKPLREFQGVLTGVPVFQGQPDQMLSRLDAHQ